MKVLSTIFEHFFTHYCFVHRSLGSYIIIQWRRPCLYYNFLIVSRLYGHIRRRLSAFRIFKRLHCYFVVYWVTNDTNFQVYDSFSFFWRLIKFHWYPYEYLFFFFSRFIAISLAKFILRTFPRLFELTFAFQITYNITRFLVFRL